MENQPNQKIKIFIDASALSDSACFRRLWMTIFHGLKPKSGREYKMEYGNALHIFAEHYYKRDMSTKEAAALAANYFQPYAENVPLDMFEFRTETNLLKTCLAYKQAFPKTSEIDFKPLTDELTGKPLVEYKFAIPIWSGEYFELILCGTMDLICAYGGYEAVIVDHKTTGKKNKIEFFRQFDLTPQTMLYSLCGKEILKTEYFPPVLINAWFLKKPTQKAEKEKVFDGVSFERSSMFEYTQEQMSEFKLWLDKKFEKIIMYLEGYNPSSKTFSPDPMEDYDYSVCHNGYTTCEFFDVCSIAKKFRQGIMDTDYKKRTYEPLKFREIA